MRGQQRRERRVPRAGHGQRLVVVDLTQAEPAVLLGDLHPEGAQVLETLEDVPGNLRVALDLPAVHPLGEEVAETVEECLALLDRARIELRLRVDQVEPEIAEKELLAERRLGPLGLTAGLGDL